MVIHLGAYGGPWDEIHERFARSSRSPWTRWAFGWHRGT